MATPDSLPTSDMTTTSTMIDLPAPGVYDDELQLSDAQVIAFKELLRKDNPLSASPLQATIVSNIIEGLMSDGTGDPEEQELLENPLVVRMMGYTARLASLWQASLSYAISLPGAEWPMGMTPPATFSEAMKTPDILSGRRAMYAHNSNGMFDEEMRLIQQVTGVDMQATDSAGTA